MAVSIKYPDKESYIWLNPSSILQRKLMKYPYIWLNMAVSIKYPDKESYIWLNPSSILTKKANEIKNIINIKIMM